jgi:hypothetical protein
MNYKIAGDFINSCESDIKEAILAEYPNYPKSHRYLNTKFISQQISKNPEQYPTLGKYTNRSIRQLLTSYFMVNEWPRYTERKHGGRVHGIIFINPAMATP